MKIVPVQLDTHESEIQPSNQGLEKWIQLWRQWLSLNSYRKCNIYFVAIFNYFVGTRNVRLGGIFLLEASEQSFRKIIGEHLSTTKKLLTRRLQIWCTVFLYVQEMHLTLFPKQNEIVTTSYCLRLHCLKHLKRTPKDWLLMFTTQ